MASNPQDPTQVIPVLGFAVLTKFDLAERLLESIDHPVKDLVIVNNSGTQSWKPKKPKLVERMWHIEVPYGLGGNGAWNLIIKSTPYAKYWVLPNDDCYFEPGALQIISEQVDTTTFNYCQINERWSCPVIGEGIVNSVGLWDEAYFPIYFDDNDFERRIVNAGIQPKALDAVVHHTGSATLNSGFHAQNTNSFINNGDRLRQKVRDNDFSVHGWSLAVRRENKWD